MKATKLLTLLILLSGIFATNVLQNTQEELTKKNNETYQDYFLECKQIISGKVVDKNTNSVISNALVTLFLNGEEIKIAKVNKNGEYSFTVNCNLNYKIVVTAENYFKETYQLITTNTNNTINKRNFYLQNECFQTITGTVINQLTDEIITTAALTLFLNGQEVENIEVDSNGLYSFKVRCDSNYYIKVAKQNYITDIYEFKTSTNVNNVNHHNFILEPECVQTISGTILNKVTNEPISATLKLMLNNVEIERIEVNNDGKYSVKFQCTTNYKIVATKPNFFEDSYNFLTDYIELNQPDYFHLKKNLYLEPNECFQTVSGTVLNANTNAVIENATVVLIYQNQEIKTFQTNEDGSYLFNVKCDHNYELKAIKETLQSELTNYKASSVKNEKGIQDLFITEESCSQIISGIIVDKNTGLTIPNSQVALLEGNLEIDSVTVDASGKFNFTVECDKNYTINAVNNDYNSASTTFSTNNTRNANISKTLELVPLDCNQTLTGTVVDKNTGLAIPNSQVALFESNLEIDSVTSDASGKFNFTVECDKNYTVNAVNNDYNSASTTFSTNNTRDANISKTLELVPLDCNQTVTGTVVDKNTGLTVANSQITLMEGTLEVDKTISNTNGVFTFELNCKKNYTLVGEHENYYIKLVQLSTDTERNKIHNLTINLSEKECNQTVTGIIRDKITKKPLPNTTISLYQNYQVIETATVGADGVYEFKINCASTYKLTVFKNNNLESFRIRTAKDNERVLTLHIDIEPPICKQYINGTVVENLTNNAIPNAKVSLFNSGKKLLETITDSNGTFYFEIDCNKDYEIRIDKANYTKGVQKITSPNTNAFSNLVEITLEPIIKFTEKNGVKYIETKPIIFELDEYELSNEAKIELNKVVYNLNQHPTIKIDVNFHTDSRGPDAYNMELTIKRAETTKDYLVSKGINPQRIIANGYGETRLLNRCSNNVNCSESEHAVNRRAEFIVLFD